MTTPGYSPFNTIAVEGKLVTHKILTALVASTLLLTSSTGYSATTDQILCREGWWGLLCPPPIPDCICKWCCPDYCKKPYPCVCGPLPPGLQCGCGSKRPWVYGYGCGSGSCCTECGSLDQPWSPGKQSTGTPIPIKSTPASQILDTKIIIPATFTGDE